MRPAAIRISRVGAEGDGVGILPNGAPAYVPLTLPGELVIANPLRARGEGWLASATSIDRSSPARVEPPCTYFGSCGGCALQHWRDTDYIEWKTSLLMSALRRAGYESLPPIGFADGRPGERRRLDFAIRRDRERFILGLHQAGSRDVVNLSHCLVLHPALMALMGPLRVVLQSLRAIRHQGSVVANLLDSGPDLLLRTDAPLSLPDRTALIEFARTHNLARLSWSPGNGLAEPVCTFRPPVCMLSGVEVRPPPGAFLQATAQGEAKIAGAVIAGLSDRLTAKARIAEMFAGCGTLTFALARKGRVTAWEGDAGSVAALREAVNRAGLSGRIDAVQRDLVRQPMTAKDLAGFSVVVLDPPHTGSAAQIAQIGASAVDTVIYVSCNPATLSRDARTLHAAGYGLVAATAIDQFLWSVRLEAVCVFRKTV